jgi:4-diphosphocytidyl-2-C-methyl-D-erythritol kinase
MKRASASAKINIGLVVGPRRDDGLHQIVTLLQRIDLADRIELNDSDELQVTGFAEDTLVRSALERIAAAAGIEPRWSAKIEKKIPVTAGLGGGSSDAATALVLANETLEQPLPPERLSELAAEVGSDVPFFLTSGPQLATGDGTELRGVELPQDYWIVLILPHGTEKQSTRAVYEAFDERDGSLHFEERRSNLIDALVRIRRPGDLTPLPMNDLASSPLARELLRAGAFRADVTGAGPTVYGMFLHERDARAAGDAFRDQGQVWITVPAWYG